MIATILAILSLAFSVFLFFRFDARIKNQERILNDYKIKEYQVAEREKLYANLTLDTMWRDKGTLYLIIANEGPSEAFNISIKDLDKESFLFKDLSNAFPIKSLIPGDSEQLELMVYCDMPDKTRVELTWEDNSKETHKEKRVLQIN